MNGRRFDIHLHFSTAEQFHRFVEIIRGGPLDADATALLLKLTADLQQSTAALKAAEDTQKEQT